MDLTKIVAVGGKPGLYQVTGQGKNNVLLESLIDGKRFAAFAQHKMSSLEEISIFTTTEDRPLKEVFKHIRETMGETLDFDAKKLNNSELVEKFELAVPDFNAEAVYPSDMKKVFSWYSLLSQKNLLVFDEETAEQAAADSEGEPTTTTE